MNRSKGEKRHAEYNKESENFRKNCIAKAEKKEDADSVDDENLRTERRWCKRMLRKSGWRRRWNEGKTWSKLSLWHRQITIECTLGRREKIPFRNSNEFQCCSCGETKKNILRLFKPKTRLRVVKKDGKSREHGSKKRQQEDERQKKNANADDEQLAIGFVANQSNYFDACHGVLANQVKRSQLHPISSRRINTRVFIGFISRQMNRTFRYAHQNSYVYTECQEIHELFSLHFSMHYRMQA